MVADFWSKQVSNDAIDQYNSLIFKCMYLFMTTVPLTLEPCGMAHCMYGAVDEAQNSLNRCTAMISCLSITSEVPLAQEVLMDIIQQMAPSVVQVFAKLVYDFRYGRFGATVIFLEIILVSHRFELCEE